MTRRELRFNIVMFCNALTGMLVTLGVYQRFQFRTAPWGTTFDAGRFILSNLSPIVVIVLLSTGILLERKSKRFAWVINFCFYLLVILSTTLGVLGREGSHPAERATVGYFVLIPAAVICMALGFLYFGPTQSCER